MKWLAIGVVAAALSAGCGDDNNMGASDGGVDMAAATGPAGGPVSGPLDDHCGAMGDAGEKVIWVQMSSCHPDAGASPAPDYGPPRYNNAAYDDDCKYTVTWHSTDVRLNQPVTFTVSAVHLSDGQPAIGAKTVAEVFLTPLHPAPNSGTTTMEPMDGKYVIGPITFDQSGRWTVRFHFYEECSDALVDSPHGHVSFFVDVP